MKSFQLTYPGAISILLGRSKVFTEYPKVYARINSTPILPYKIKFIFENSNENFEIKSKFTAPWKPRHHWSIYKDQKIIGKISYGINQNKADIEIGDKKYEHIPNNENFIDNWITGYDGWIIVEDSKVLARITSIAIPNLGNHDEKEIKFHSKLDSLTMNILIATLWIIHTPTGGDE